MPEIQGREGFAESDRQIYAGAKEHEEAVLSEETTLILSRGCRRVRGKGAIEPPIVNIFYKHGTGSEAL